MFTKGFLSAWLSMLKLSAKTIPQHKFGQTNKQIAWQYKYRQQN